MIMSRRFCCLCSRQFYFSIFLVCHLDLSSIYLSAIFRMVFLIICEKIYIYIFCFLFSQIQFDRSAYWIYPHSLPWDGSVFLRLHKYTIYINTLPAESNRYDRSCLYGQQLVGPTASKKSMLDVDMKFSAVFRVFNLKSIFAGRNRTIWKKCRI